MNDGDNFLMHRVMHKAEDCFYEEDLLLSTGCEKCYFYVDKTSVIHRWKNC